MSRLDVSIRARKTKELLDQELELLFDSIIEEHPDSADWLLIPIQEIKAGLRKKGIDTRSWEERLCRLLALAEW